MAHKQGQVQASEPQANFRQAFRDAVGLQDWDFRASRLCGGLYKAYFSPSAGRTLPDGNYKISDSDGIGRGVSELQKHVSRGGNRQQYSYYLVFKGSPRMSVHASELGFSGNGSIVSQSGELKVVISEDKTKIDGVEFGARGFVNSLSNKGVSFEGSVQKNGVGVVRGKEVRA